MILKIIVTEKWGEKNIYWIIAHYIPRLMCFVPPNEFDLPYQLCFLSEQQFSVKRQPYLLLLFFFYASYNDAMRGILSAFLLLQSQHVRRRRTHETKPTFTTVGNWLRRQCTPAFNAYKYIDRCMVFIVIAT